MSEPLPSLSKKKRGKPKTNSAVLDASFATSVTSPTTTPLPTTHTRTLSLSGVASHGPLDSSKETIISSSSDSLSSLTPALASLPAPPASLPAPAPAPAPTSTPESSLPPLTSSPALLTTPSTLYDTCCDKSRVLKQLLALPRNAPVELFPPGVTRDMFDEFLSDFYSGMHMWEVKYVLRSRFAGYVTEEDLVLPFIDSPAECEKALKLFWCCKIAPLTGCWLYDPSKVDSDTDDRVENQVEKQVGEEKQVHKIPSKHHQVAQWKWGPRHHLHQHPIISTIDRGLVRHNPLRCELLRSRRDQHVACCRPSHLLWASNKQNAYDEKIRERIEEDPRYREEAQKLMALVDEIAKEIDQEERVKYHRGEENEEETD